MQRALVVFPREDIFNVKQETPVILINRSHCQSYFILDLHDRYHCDVGVNGTKMLLEFLHDKAIDYVMVKNKEKNISQALNLIVMNQNDTNSKDDQYMNWIKKILQ